MLASDKKQPLYLQMVDMLEVEIRDSMAPNDKLLSERELSIAYGVSRITVRLALKELEERGLIYKKQGKGTYVSEISEPAKDLASAYSFTEQMRALGKTPETQLLSFEEEEVSDYLSGQLNLELGSHVLELERLRLADGKPMMFERSYLPYDLFAGLDRDLLLKKPLYDIFSEDFDQTVRLAEEEFYASIALDYEAQLLQIRKGDPVLHIIRKTFNDKNNLIEFTFSIARADQFRYKISHNRSQ